MFFNHFAFLQVIHCHYQSQASSMPSKEEWFTYDTTVFLHLNNHIHNQRKEMQERKQGNDGHLQHIMASLVIIYNLCSDFLTFQTDFSLFSERGHHSSGWTESIGIKFTESHSRFHAFSPESQQVVDSSCSSINRIHALGHKLSIILQIICSTTKRIICVCVQES